MAKPILIVRLPEPYTHDSLDQANEYVTRKCPDYNVLVIHDDCKSVTFQILTEHNQPEGLAT